MKYLFRLPSAAACGLALTLCLSTLAQAAPHLQAGSPFLGAGTGTGASDVAQAIATNEDIFVSSDVNGGPPSTIEEFTSAGQHVRSIPVPNNAGSDAANGTGYLRGIAVNDAGQIVGFNGMSSPELATFFPNTHTFTARTAPGWDIASNVSSGSVGVYGAYSFVLSDNVNNPPAAIIRFNPDGTSQQFGAATNSENNVNLTVGLDGKLYVLYSDPSSGFFADVYDPNTLQLLRTVTLQVPSAHGNQSTDLRSLAVDASGGIYVIDLYNYMYHLDPNGSVLQSATHTQNGYATDVKIDPMSGRVLVGISGYGGQVLQTDATLSSFTTLIQLDPSEVESPFIAFGNAALESALDASHVLWTNTNGQASVWNLNDANPAATCQVFGPYPGWTATALAEGPDGSVRLLWDNTSGQISVWNLADAHPDQTCQLYGPFSGWTAKSITVGPDNAAHLLWDNTDGRVSLWNLTDPNPAATCLIEGPYSGWSGTAIAIGPNNQERLLWDNTDGHIAVWNFADANPAATCLVYGSYSGWTATALAVGPDNAAHLLWDNVNGPVSLWNLNDANPAATCLIEGPYSGWSGTAIALGTNNQERLLWDNTGGPISVWNLADPNPPASALIYGPYSGWAAVGISAAP